MKLKCPECNVYAAKEGRSICWTCPECHAVIQEPTAETCRAVLAGDLTAEDFVLGDSCQDCMHFSCPVQAVDAEEKWMQDEMASMFGDDEDAQEAFEEGHAPDKD